MSGEHIDYDHERTDVPVRWPIYLGIGMLLTLPITVAIISALMSSVWAPPKTAAGPDISVAPPAANAPQLQTDPQGDLAKLRKKWDKQLHGTGWVDRKSGIAHVPIAQAEKHLLRNGLPQDTGVPPPSRVQGELVAPPGGNSDGGHSGTRMAKPEPQRTSPDEQKVKPGANSGADHAGNGASRGARNQPGGGNPTPYRQGTMDR